VALAASLLERLDGVNAALLAATERAVKAEGARDTAQAATVDLRAHLADVQAERDAAAARAQAAEAELQRLRARRWYDPRTW
jgi:chromosome segregation ATPase